LTCTILVKGCGAPKLVAVAALHHAKITNFDDSSFPAFHFSSSTGGPSASFVHDYVQAFYEQYVYPKMTPEQQAVLVPGSFGSNANPACNTTCYDAMCSLDANNFFSWAR
jgi:hypothetical protein